MRAAPGNQSHLNAKFHAVTLRPNQKTLPTWFVERSDIRKLLNQHPVGGSLALVLGPIGSGKTAVATQWAADHGSTLQYISARRTADIPQDWIEPANDLGDRVSDFLNFCTSSDTQCVGEDIRTRFENLIELASRSSQSVIIDDIDFLSISSLETLGGYLSKGLRELTSNRVLLVGRTIDPALFDEIQSTGQLRVVLPSYLEFSEVETARGHELGIFGNASLEEMMKVRANENGWILGMRSEAQFLRNRRSELLSVVVNDFLLQIPQTVAKIVMAAARIPVNESGLWEVWFQRFGLDIRMASTTRSMLPTTEVFENQGFAIVPSMRRALESLEPIGTTISGTHRLLVEAVGWFERQNDIEMAWSIANKHSLEGEFFEAVKGRCRALAEKEQWPAISVIVGRLPNDVLALDHDVAFWMLLGLLETARIQRMQELFDLVKPQWEQSRDDLVLGRYFLFRSWQANVRCQTTLMSELGEKAYNTLPKHVYRERLWAAGTVSVAEAQMADSAKSHEWSAKTYPYMSLVPEPLRWWHNNAGPMRLSSQAISGRLPEALSATEWQITDLMAAYPEGATRYFVLQAFLCMEQFQYDAAASLLDLARSVSIRGFAHTHHIQMATAELQYGTGNIREAWETLLKEHAQPSAILFHGNRAATNLARIAIQIGDVDQARYLINSQVRLNDPWPRNFGDAHQGLVSALIHLAEGRFDSAIEFATKVAAESQARGHRYYSVQAYSTIAYIYAHLNQPEDMAKSVAMAKNVDRYSGFQRSFVVNGVDVRSIQVVDSNHGVNVTSSLSARSGKDVLTPRELEVLRLISQSLSNAQISEQLFVSLSTVKSHVGRIYQKLGTNHRSMAIHIAQKRGLLADSGKK